MEEKPTSSIATEPLTVLNGGFIITVEHIDGVSENIKVRQIPLRHMAEYGDASGDEGKLLELFTNKPAEWIDGLTQVSQERIVEIGDLLNRDPFLRWSERRISANEKLKPMLARSRALAISALASVRGADTPPSSYEG